MKVITAIKTVSNTLFFFLFTKVPKDNFRDGEYKINVLYVRSAPRVKLFCMMESIVLT